MESKISMAEIAKLRASAEKECEIHAQIMCEIAEVENCHKQLEDGLLWIEISAERQLEILKRNRRIEVLSLLQAYEGMALSEEAQIFIFDAPMGYDEAKQYMVNHTKLCLAVVKKLIDKRIFPENKRLSAEGEVYFIEKSIQMAEQEGSIQPLQDLEEYIHRIPLDPSAEKVMVKNFLNHKTGRDSVIDGFYNFVINYICLHRGVAGEAQQEIVKSGKHKAILAYIRDSSKNFDDDKAIELLLARADRKEVTAYFNRYAGLN